MKRRVPLLTGFILAAMVAAIPAIAADQVAVVKVWDFHVGDKKFRQNIFKQFSRDNPDIKVEYTSQVIGTYPTVVDMAMRSGTPPDLFATAGIPVSLAKMAEIGWAMPLEDLAPSKDAFQKWVSKFPEEHQPFLDSVNMVNGKIYSWPASGEAGRIMLFWNTKMFADAGLKGAGGGAAVPETWDDMRLFAKKITEQGQGKSFGIVEGIKSPAVWDMSIFRSIAPAAGWPVQEIYLGYGFDYRTGLFVYHHPGLFGAIQLWMDMRKDGSILPGELSMDDEMAKFKFAQELAGMIFGGPWIPGGMLAVNDALQFDVVLPPTPERGVRKGFAMATPLAGSSEYVASAKTKNPRAVWKVIEFMTSAEFQEGWVKAGGGISAFPEYNKPEFFPHPTIAKTALMGTTGRRAVPPFPPGTSRVWDFIAGTVGMPDAENLMQGQWVGKLGWEAWDDLEKRWNVAFDNALAEARKAGINLTRADFTFPDWDPTKNYIPKKK